jgi:hypothetical protein
MTLSETELLELVRDTAWPAMRGERDRLDIIDRWCRWDHDKPHTPRHSTNEYKELSSRSQTPWLGLVVTAVAQSLYVEGYRRATEDDNAKAWATWQANGMDSRQVPLHRAALSYGLAYMTVLPGESPEGAIPVMRGVSPRRMIAFYEYPADDEWPVYALRCDPAKVAGEKGWKLRIYDDKAVYFLTADSGGDKFTYVETRDHNVGVCPVVRFANSLDLEGRADGEVEPLISVAARIDQTIFDRLVVQRFASWVVRTIAGMSAPEKLSDEETQAYLERTKLRLRAEDILIADDPDTKFGSLPATPLTGFIEARDADIKDLAAVSQTPPHHLLGQMANLSAEALAAAEAALSRKVTERKHLFGESHEQALRLAASVAGDSEGAMDYSAQVRWRDVESRSLAQVADALGKLATMLGVPEEMLWTQIPGWTDQDVERAKSLRDAAATDAEDPEKLRTALAPVLEALGLRLAPSQA